MADASIAMTEAALAAEAIARRMNRAWSLEVYAQRPEAVEREISAARTAYEELGAQLAQLEAPKLPHLRGLRLVETAVGTVELPVVGRVNGGDEPRPAA